MDTVIQILLFGGLIFVMMRFGCGSHMFGGGHGKGGHGKDGHGNKKAGGCCGGGDKKHSDIPSENAPHQHAPPKDANDPVCGKTVATDGARTSFHEGLVYYFCSNECRETFEAAPNQHLNQKDEASIPRLEQRPMESGGR